MGGYYGGFSLGGGYSVGGGSITTSGPTVVTVQGTSTLAASPVAPVGYYSGGNYPYYPQYYGGQPSFYYGQSNPSYYGQPTLSNQVLAYTDTNPNIDSVYLSDIPSTGFGDYYSIIIFISLLLSWSTILAYVFLKRKIEAQKLFANAYVDVMEAKNDKNNFATSAILNQIVSDNSDISKVEEYARINKVLLSSDASAKLVKLSRLGKINSSEYIRSIAKDEWITVGENQISKGC